MKGFSHAALNAVSMLMCADFGRVARHHRPLGEIAECPGRLPMPVSLRL